MDANRLISGSESASTIASAVPQSPRRAIYVNPQGTLRLPVEPDMPLDPALRLQVQAPNEGNAALTVSHLTGGLDWDADYIAVLRGENALKASECWATVTNQTGLTFPNARVSLATGVAPRIGAGSIRQGRELLSGATAHRWGAIAQRIVPQPLGEVYTYPLARFSLHSGRPPEPSVAPREALAGSCAEAVHLSCAVRCGRTPRSSIGKEVRRDKAEGLARAGKPQRTWAGAFPYPTARVRTSMRPDSNGTLAIWARRA